MADLLLSICIPTNGISKWVLPTLNSIYSQNVALDRYEVVVVDNGEDSTLESDLPILQYANLRYVKSKDEGFLNLVTSLQEGKGVLRKMLNHRSIMLPDSINRWLDIANTYKKSKPIIYFSDNQLCQGRIIECENEDVFVRNMTYLCSWSAGLSVWDIDADNLQLLKLNPMFPNTSILFNIRKVAKYIIVDEKYQQMQDETGKGGYPLFQTFAITYLDMISELRCDGRISLDTFIKVKYDLLNFLGNWLITLKVDKMKYTFMEEDIKKVLNVYYSNFDYFRISFKGYYLCSVARIKRLIKVFLKGK